MIAFIIKSTLSLLLFFLFYRFILEKENMPVFKRFYLLTALLFSFVISTIVIKTTDPGVSAKSLLNSMEYDQGYYTLKEITKQSVSAFSVKWIVLSTYFLVFLVFMLRFLVNILRLARLQSTGKRVFLGDYQIIFHNRPLLPFTFFSSVYVNEQEYRDGLISQELIQHELAHARQKHSVDIVFIELLQVILWFNPIIPFFRRSIRLNHEYLADSAVIDAKTDLNTYQNQLLNIVFRNNSTYLASCFNYSFTKKRLIMMTKNNSSRLVLLKKISVIPLFMLAGLFVINAQDPPPPPPPPPPPSEAPPPPPPPPEFLKDKWWQDILQKHNIKATGQHADVNMYVISETSSLDLDKRLVSYEKVFMLLRDKDGYSFVEAQRAEAPMVGEYIKFWDGTIKRYKNESKEPKPYEEKQFQDLVLAIEK